MKICSIKKIGKCHVRDIEIETHHNFVVNGVVAHNCTSQGAQRFFKKAKPRSIVDIAALTSIYRPGPLAAKVDQLWTQHESEPFDWGHPLINDTLKETRGLLVFQESVMALANKVGGFPMERCDEIRRAIMKRSISGGEAAKKEAQKMEDGFVSGAVSQGVPESIAKKAYQTILWMSGYGFNKAHAVSYSIDSYFCAWLMRHHEESWLTAYIESMLGNPENKAKAFGEVKALGYQIVSIDINHAEMGWTVLPGKKFMPSFLSCKGIGESAVEEVLANRPFKSIEDLLWNEDGTWRPSKFNKRALDALIKVGAFESLDCVGPDKIFSSYHHMHEVIVENQDLIKKTSKKDPHLGRKNFYELARKLSTEVTEWSKKELAEFNVDIFGSLDASALVDPRVIARLEQKGVKPIDQVEQGEKEIAWFVVTGSTQKTTKTKKTYTQLEVVGLVGKPVKLNVWGNSPKQLPLYALCFAEVERNDFGMSTAFYKLKEVA